ncbi:MAG: hypothetical protein KAJ51_12910 [Thermoplasmata archaeon]|nr:hypothetical protein [Thermoplasmata archaeon]
MTRDKKRIKWNGCTLNLAWNGNVHRHINRGVYNKYFQFDQSKISVRFFGTAPGIAWNGGRKSKRIGSFPISKLIEHVIWLNKHDIGFNFVFNSTLIDDKLLMDEIANDILRACKSPINGVVCASNLLSTYIESEYPEYQRYASCILSNNYAQGLEELFEQYDVIVLPEDLNTDFNYLNRLLNPEKIEVILNSSCVYKCPFRAKHYHLIHQEIQREILKKPAIEWNAPCSEIIDQHDWVLRNDKIIADKQFIFPDILHKYLRVGIRRFKFLDRVMPPDLELLSNYWNQLQEHSDLYCIR